MNYNEINLVDFLKNYIYKDVVYCSNSGNAGDGLIAHSTYHLFNKINFRPQIIQINQIVQDKIIFYSGGGNLIEKVYKDAYNFVNKNYQSNKEIIFLPHTVFGYEDFLKSKGNITIICREKLSYERLVKSGFPDNRLFLSHDIAFTLKDSELNKYKATGTGTAYCLRLDGESHFKSVIPPNNYDISKTWMGNLWYNPEMAKLVTHTLACYLSGFESVKTDRLHIAILGCLLNKKVTLFPNIYYKNKAVFDYSIKDKFENCQFSENHDALQNDFPEIKNNNDNSLLFGLLQGIYRKLQKSMKLYNSFLFRKQ